jgi:hypothetical protein
MSAHLSSTARTPAPPVRLFTDQEARTFDEHHQQVLFIKNRILNLLEVSNVAARAINGIHGMMNGQRKFPIFKAHKWAARQMDYKGSDENADQFMCRRLSAVDEAEEKCGYRFFEIVRADGVAQLMTSYDADYLGGAIQWVLVQARNLPDFWTNPAAAISDDLLWQAIRLKLPVRPPTARSPGDEANGSSITDDALIKAGWTRMETLNATQIERIKKAGGDPLREVERFCKRLIKQAQAEHFAERMKDERAKSEKKRARDGAFDGLIEVSDNPSSREVSGKVRVSDSFEVQDFSDTPLQSDPPPGENPHVFANNEEAALLWATRGVPVFPAYTPDEKGVCDCRAGAECKSPGKHPRTFTGLKEASQDTRQILKWFRQWPDANVGGVTGEKSGLLVVDEDPKSGGDLTLTDLIEAHGDEWLDTLTVKTGSGGYHFFFEYPAGLDLRNTAGKIGPGIDTRANGGYVILPSSKHASGRRYELVCDARPRPLPDWLLEILTSKQNTQVIDFQVKERRPVGGGPIPEGLRNDHLFRIGCALWGKGEARDATDLHARLSDINEQRCVPSLAGAEVSKMAANITARYTRGVPISDDARYE